MSKIAGRELFFEIVSNPSSIRAVHWNCVRELVGTVVLKHFPMNNNDDFIDNFTQELFSKLLPTLHTWEPSPKVHYGNYFYTIIKNTILNHVNKEFRYGLDLLSISDDDINSTFNVELDPRNRILSKYRTSLLGQTYCLVDEEDVDDLIHFLNTKGL